MVLLSISKLQSFSGNLLDFDIAVPIFIGFKLPCTLVSLLCCLATSSETSS